MAIFHIVGAGVSGLTLAYELAKNGAQVRIYEKLGLPGGLARTEILNHKRICGLTCHQQQRNSRLLAAAAGDQIPRATTLWCKLQIREGLRVSVIRKKHGKTIF